MHTNKPLYNFDWHHVKMYLTLYANGKGSSLSDTSARGGFTSMAADHHFHFTPFSVGVMTLKDCLPFYKISLDNMQYFQNELYKF